MSSVEIVFGQRDARAAISAMTLSSGGIEKEACESDVEVGSINSPVKVSDDADVRDTSSAQVPRPVIKGRPNKRRLQQKKPTAAQEQPTESGTELLEIDGEPVRNSPAKLRPLVNVAVPCRAAQPSKARKASRRRKNEESETCQPRKRQASRTDTVGGAAEPSVATEAEGAGGDVQDGVAINATATMAIKAEVAGPSEAPKRKGKAASAAASNAQPPSSEAGKPKLKTASKTAGTTQKAPAAKKVKKEVSAGAACPAAGGVIERRLSKAELDAALAGLERAAPHKEMKHEPGKEPYRKFGIRVNEQPCVSAEEVKMVKDCQKKYWEVLQKTRREEDDRIAENNGVNEDGTKKSKRPDTKARKKVNEMGLCVNTKKTAGHVPGHPPSSRYFLRSEMGILGIHFPPLTGIDYCTAKQIPAGCPEFAISIVNSGCYEDDDDKGEQLIYTGQGGCDLLGNKKQIYDQEMRAGNKALVGNIELGIPIRVIRKNKDPASEYGNIFIYDGLYDVVKFWGEKGREGYEVFKYLMIRRPGQAELLSKSLAFGGTSAPKNHSIESRGKHVHVVSKDISNGLERIPVPAVNEEDEELPFPTAADGGSLGQGPSGSNRIRSKERGVSLPLLRYIVDYEFDEKVPDPEPRVLPAKFKKNPHGYIKELNGGDMPYSKNKNNVSVVDTPRAMIFECGPWTGCPDGVHCGYAVSQQGLQWRLEVFKTRFKGWGVRSWDTIPVGSYITTFVGRVHRIEDCNESKDDTFYFDLGKRTDFDWYNKHIEGGHDPNQVTKYYVDGGEIGGMSRYINHSCDPNLYVQPVLCDHADVNMPKICLFAAKNIPPFEELTYDYGPQYVRENLDGKCNCGTPYCQNPAI